MITLPVDFDYTLFIAENVELGIIVVTFAFICACGVVAVKLAKQIGYVG